MASAEEEEGSPLKPLDTAAPGRVSLLRTICFHFLPVFRAVGGVVIVLLILLLLWTSVRLLSLKSGDRLRFASYYGHHMVLQKEPAGAVLWGYGKSYGPVAVLLYKENSLIVKKITQVEGPFKIWKTVLNPTSEGGPYSIEIQQNLTRKRAKAVLNDVYFGDVWLCSGQSNMEMGMAQIFNVSKEFEEASKFPLVRIFQVSHSQAEQELQDLTGDALEWVFPTSANLNNYQSFNVSAVCWLFGCYLFETLKYPIGLVDSSWSATVIENWSSRTALDQCGLSKEFFRKYVNFSIPITESMLWNAMIHPLVNMTFRGAIWYQGESNTKLNTDFYNCTFPTLIEDWRRNFHAGSEGQTERFFPFGFVQKRIDDTCPRVRWHQTADFGYVPNRKMPNTFMAVAVDLGDFESPYGSVHPRDKRTVAYRLHLGARAVAYGEKNLIFQGPYPQRVRVVVAEKFINVTFGQKIRLHHLDKKIFEVCCPLVYGVCTWIPVPMATSSPFTVTLENPTCSDSVEGLRYAWTSNPCDYKQCPIYNAQMLPTPPFIIFPQNYSNWTVLSGHI